METNSNKKFWIIGIVLLLIAGIFLYMRSGSYTRVIPEAKPVVNALTVRDQAAQTLVVTIDSASCTKNCFVAIYEATGSTTGALVGSSKLLGPREHRNETVTVKTQSGKSYIAQLHADDGNGIFNAKLDMPLKDDSGKVVSAVFSVRDIIAEDETKG